MVAQPTVYLVSLDFVQTKGTAALTNMFADVQMHMTLLLGAVGEIWQSLKCRLRTERCHLYTFTTSFLCTAHVT